MAGNSTDPGRSVASKVTAILMAFTDGAVLNLTEIAGIAKLPTSTAHRLASELLAWRLLERTENGGYRIGLPLQTSAKTSRTTTPQKGTPHHAGSACARRAGEDRSHGRETGRPKWPRGRLPGPFGQCTQNVIGADGLAPALPAYATAIGKARAFSPNSVVNRVLPTGCRPRTR